MTLWATTKGRPFSCCRITEKRKEAVQDEEEEGDFREEEGGGGLAFETGPAQMYGAGGLGCGCW